MTTTSTFEALRRFWWIVVAFTLGGAVVGGLPAPESAADSVTRWTASHTILVSSSSSTGSIYSDPLLFNQLQLFATTGQVPERAAEAIEYNGAPAALAAQVSVIVEQQSGALRITTTQNDADRAVEVADVFADELVSYMAERQDQVRQDRLTASLTRLQGLETELVAAEDATLANPDDALAASQLDALSRQYSVVFEQYNVLQADQGGQLVLTTLERAQPVAITERGLGAPTSRLGRGLLGAVAGLALGVGVAVVLARSDRRIRTREQAEEVLGMGAHVTIPHIDDHDASELAVVANRHDPLSDSYRTLRSILSFVDADDARHRERGAITLVVSPSAGDGKTSVTANLALAFAESGADTVAVNTDFRRPMLSSRFGVPHAEPVGFTLGEIEQAPLELLLAPVGEVPLSLFDISSVMGYSPGDLARTTSRVLPRLAAASQHVVIDSSPVTATAETLEFVPMADTIVVVVTLGQTSIQSTQRALETLQALSTGKILLALIGGDERDSSYYYYYHSTTESESSPGRFSRFRKTSKSDTGTPKPDHQPAVPTGSE